MSQSEQLHASCVSIDGKGVLILGESGSGKSDLALRLCDQGAKLVGDDYVLLHQDGNTLLASPVLRIAGAIEIRGVGVLNVPFVPRAPLALVVKLIERKGVERMPEVEFFDCLERQVPLQCLHAFDSSTPAKIRTILKFRSASEV